jgi:putative copper resistance protein D
LIDAAFAALAAARWIHFASVMLLFGASLFPFYVLPTQISSPELARARGALLAAAVVAFISGLAWAAASLANITGDAASLLDRDALTAFLFDTGFGKVWALRFLLLLALLIIVVVARRNLGSRSFAAGLVALLGASLLVSQAWIGHPAASAGAERNFIIAGYALHVLGGGAWLGGLLPLWLLLRDRDAQESRADLETAVDRFSALGMLAIAAILAGGLINAWARWSALDVVLASAWGKVLIVKIAGFVALVVLAIVNRFVLMPRLAAQAPARARFLRNVVMEQVGGLAILAAAAMLGILPPPG